MYRLADAAGERQPIIVEESRQPFPMHTNPDRPRRSDNMVEMAKQPQGCR